MMIKGSPFMEAKTRDVTANRLDIKNYIKGDAKMKKRLAALALCLTVAGGSLTACGGGGAETTAATTAVTTAAESATAAQETTAAAETKTGAETQEGAKSQAGEEQQAAGGLKEISEAMAEGPVLLTSVGQSADVNVVQTLLKKCEIECEMNPTVTADGLDGYKTIVFAIGGSSKGLGAAGIDENQEIERVKSVIKKAEEQGLTMIALHIGGSARRGTLSDKFVPDALAAADAAIIVSEGDSDGMMKGIVTENGITTTFVENQIGAMEPLKIAFGK